MRIQVPEEYAQEPLVFGALRRARPTFHGFMASTRVRTLEVRLFHEPRSRRPRWARFSVLAAAALLLAGTCGCLNLKPKADPTRFYVLSATVEVPLAPNQASAAAGSVGVRVDLPAWLDRPGIARRQSANRVEFSTLHNWAEPLREGVARVLRHDLSALLGPSRVATRSASAGVEGREVQVLIDRFELTATGRVVFSARWRVVRSRTGEVLQTGRCDQVRECPTADADWSGAVLALSQALGDLSRDVMAAASAD